MAIGSCRATIVFGNELMHCKCPSGFFDLSIDSTIILGSTTCKRCGHTLSQHNDFAPEEDRSAGFPKALRPSDLGPLICRREATVAELWHQLQRCGILHARGTPACGKTTLGILLQDFIQRVNPETTIYRISWPSSIPEKYSVSTYHVLLNDILHLPSNFSWDFVKNTVLIIDEAQLSYTYYSLWNDLIKKLTDSTGSGLYLLLLSSYGSPSSIAVRPLPGSSPVILSSERRISIRPLSNTNASVGLYYTFPEFEDAVQRFCDSFETTGQPLIISDGSKDVIWSCTNGHPSAVRCLLEFIAHSKELRPTRLKGNPITREHTELALAHEATLFNWLENGSHSFSRSLPRKETVQAEPNVAQTLREVLASGRISGELQCNVGLQQCYRRGWLQAEAGADAETLYYFPTFLHRRYAEILLQGDLIAFPLAQYPTLRKLVLSSLRNFSRTSLQSAGRGLTTGATQVPLESQYRDEVYRALYVTLGQRIFLTSEWAPYSRGGRVDFLLKKVKWGIECVREGDRLEEHICRFVKGGRYYEWIQKGQMTDYVVIDFRKTKPLHLKDVPFLIYVVYKEDFSSYEVFDATLKPLHDRLGLLS